MNNQLLNTLGTLAGIAGLLVSLISGAIRLTGAYTLAGFGLQSMMIGGIALLLTGCFLKLEAISRSG